jgi:uncharacterized phiE125 gp8 family phage protein
LIRITLQSIYIGGDIVPDWRFGGELEKVKPKYQEISIIETGLVTNEPLSLTEVKNNLKIDYSTDDDLLTGLIKSVRVQIETELGGVNIIRRNMIQKQTGGVEFIELLRQPVNSIASIIYFEDFDSTGETITDYRQVNNILYHRDTFFKVGRAADGYVITYNAGLIADAVNANLSVPSNIKTAMQRVISYLYENRQQYASTYSEGGWSITYNKEMRQDINLLLMPNHSGRGIF